MIYDLYEDQRVLLALKEVELCAENMSHWLWSRPDWFFDEEGSKNHADLARALRNLHEIKCDVNAEHEAEQAEADLFDALT